MFKSSSQEDNQLSQDLQTLRERLDKGEVWGSASEGLYLFLLNLALNHECVLDSEEEVPRESLDDPLVDQEILDTSERCVSSEKKTRSIQYTGQSPDEITLLETA